VKCESDSHVITFEATDCDGAKLKVSAHENGELVIQLADIDGMVMLSAWQARSLTAFLAGALPQK
jgi:hypothetical protein